MSLTTDIHAETETNNEFVSMVRPHGHTGSLGIFGWCLLANSRPFHANAWTACAPGIRITNKKFDRIVFRSHVWRGFAFYRRKLQLRNWNLAYVCMCMCILSEFISHEGDRYEWSSLGIMYVVRRMRLWIQYDANKFPNYLKLTLLSVFTVV